MRVLCLMAVLLAGGAQAQGFGPGCGTQWAAINSFLVDSGLTKAPVARTPRQTAGGCAVSDIDLPGPDRLDVRARVLRWSGQGIGRFTDQGLPPTAITLGIEGLRFVPQIDDPVMDYLFRAQSVPGGIDVKLSAKWEAETGRLILETVEADFPGDNFIRHEAEVTGVDLSTRQAMEMSAGSFAITQTRTEIRTNGLFETYILMAIGAPLLTGEAPPEEQVATLKEKALADIAAMPDAIVAPASKDALQRLVGDMPNPAGTITIEMAADPGLGPARFLPLALNRDMEGLTDIWPLLDGVRLDVSYAP